MLVTNKRKMDKFIIICLISVVTAEVTNPIEEKYSEDQNVRTVRNSDKNPTKNPPKAYQPHVFNFQTATQQDPQRNRYALQQQADLQNLKNQETFNSNKYHDHRKSRSNFNRKSDTEGDKNEWVPIVPIGEKTEEEVVNTMELMKVNAPEVENKHTKRSSKKLKPISYFEKDEERTDKIQRRQDGVDQIMSEAHPRYIYIQPNILKNNFGIDPKEAQKILKNAAIPPQGQNYEVLSDLVGKNPNVQLEELRKLLEGPMANNIFTVDHKTLKPDHKSVVEHGMDDPKVDQKILKQLQDQLDMSSKEHTSNVLLQAQQQAAAHVKAQHAAIAAAAERLNKEAYAKIAATNQGIPQGLPQGIPQGIPQGLPQGLPQALALTSPLPQQVQLPQFVQQVKAPQIVKNVQIKLPQLPKIQHTHYQQAPQAFNQIPKNHQVKYNSPTPQTYIVSSTTPRPTHVIYIPQPQGLKLQQQPIQQIVPKPTEMEYTVHHQPTPTPISTKLQTFHTHPLLTKAKFVAAHAQELQQTQKYIVPIANYKTIAIPSAKPDMQLYAPTHHHQITALLQAERVVQEQVKQQNAAILQAHAQKEAARQATANVVKEKKIVHKEPLQLPTTYQEVILENDSDNKINSRPYREQHDDNQDLQYAAKYAFGYQIRDNKMDNDFGHEEKRDGKMTKGEYHVLLPDGRLQNVEYYADDSGYHAKVSYKNMAQH